MKTLRTLILGLALTVPALTVPALGDTPATMPTAPTAATDSSSPDPMLGKLFRSRVDGIQFNPPNGGTMIRELQTAEIVRFVYTAKQWDIRVKPGFTAKVTPLKGTKQGDGLVDMMATQITDQNPTAVILSQKVEPLQTLPPQNIGRIEARYKAGTDEIFAQEAIILDPHENNQHYFVLQMSSPGRPKNAAINAVDAGETEARTMFEHVLATVKVLDRKDLRDEQDRRIYAAREVFLQMDRKKFLSAMEPLHFMRVIHDGKDIGFVQVNERLANHNGHEGIEYIVHSRVETGADQVMDAARAQVAAAPEPHDLSAASSANNIVVPNGLAPTTAPAMSNKPTNLYTESTYFVSFNRKNEDWTSTTQVDQQVASQLTEMGNTDFVDKLTLNAAEAQAQMNVVPQPGVKHQRPGLVKIPEAKLDVSQYTHNRPLGKPVNIPVPPQYYLPQAMGQMLPRLLPADAGQYYFASYVSSQKNLMARYVDVGKPTEALLDGKEIYAIPISDRIGVEGIPTIHYVTHDGKWLGSVVEDSKLVVLPADEKTLTAIWKNDSRGFKVCPLPEPQKDEPTAPRRAQKSASTGGPDADVKLPDAFGR
jgi:hypothetical protein